MKNKLMQTACAAAAVATVAGVYACSASENSVNGDPAGTNGNGSGGSAGNGNGGVGNLAVGGGGGNGGDCENLDLEPNLETVPADIIFVIDNSGSMSEEAAAIEQNLNQNFAQIIGASNIDYQVIMLTAHGPGSTQICIQPPLSSTSDCNSAPGETATFKHYDMGPPGGDGVQSLDSLCIILDTFYGSNGGGEGDEHGLHPEGWSKWLRPEAVKVFVEITDDGVQCSWDGTTFRDYTTVSPFQDDPNLGKNTATLFDNRLLTLSPYHFGTTESRNYLFYSIVGVVPKVSPLEPYQHTDPVVGGAQKCTTAVKPASGYQWLSRGTGALRFPVCNTSSYDVIFQDIAAGVIKGSALPCEFDLPDPGNGEEPDLNTVSLIYTPGDVMGPPEELQQVPNAAACGSLNNAFWLDDSVVPPRVHLCPEACNKVESDTLATINVRFQCGGVD